MEIKLACYLVYGTEFSKLISTFKFDCIWHSLNKKIFTNIPEEFYYENSLNELIISITETKKKPIRICVFDIHSYLLDNFLDSVMDTPGVEIFYFTSYMDNASFQIFYGAEKFLFYGKPSTPPIGFLASMDFPYIFIGNYKPKENEPIIYTASRLFYLYPGVKEDRIVGRKFKTLMFSILKEWSLFLMKLDPEVQKNVSLDKFEDTLTPLFLSFTTSHQFICQTLVEKIMREQELIMALFKNNAGGLKILPIKYEFVNDSVKPEMTTSDIKCMLKLYIDMTKSNSTGNAMLHQYSSLVSNVFREAVFYYHRYKLENSIFYSTGMGTKLSTKLKKKLFY